MATGFPVKANYATGDVLTAANMNDLSGTVNYLQYMPPRNPVLNSNFSVWQRGTSIAIPASTGNTYNADRWTTQTGAAAITLSRQSTNDTTNLPNIQYCMRYQRNSGQTGTNTVPLVQAFETVNTIPFVGKTVTLSFYARAGANYSPTGSALAYDMQYGTGTDQNPLVSYTGATSILSGTATLTTTWQRFTATATIPATATEMFIRFNYSPTGTAGAADYYEVTGVQVELGSSANTYMPNQPTYQGELAACQRYYYRASAINNYTQFTTYAGAASTTLADTQFILPVTMRTTPNTLETSNLCLSDNTTIYTGGTYSIVSSAISLNILTIRYTHGSTALTQYRPYSLTGNNSTSAYIGISAEL